VADAPQVEGVVTPRPAVADLLRPPVGAASSFSLSRSSTSSEIDSFCSVRRLNNAAGGVAAAPSPLENREVLGEANDVSGNGYASLVSRRRFPGRVCVGDVSPYGPGLFKACDIDVFRAEPPAAGVPSLLANVGGLIGEFTEPLKSCVR
jgi:hypothetical protein